MDNACQQPAANNTTAKGCACCIHYGDMYLDLCSEGGFLSERGVFRSIMGEKTTGGNCHTLRHLMNGGNMYDDA